jgi:hypothetical protein
MLRWKYKDEMINVKFQISNKFQKTNNKTMKQPVCDFKIVI